MSKQFESQKNAKAGTYTGLVVGLLLLVFFIVSWTIPTIPPPPIDQGIEVNLGNSDKGLGDIAPQVPGEPSAAEKEVKTPPKTTAVKAEPVKAVETDDNDKEAPPVVVHKPAVSTPKALNIPKKENTNPVKSVRPKPEVIENPKPEPPKPAAVYKGGNGSGPGGNNADSYNKSRNQGIAGGSGDQGKINGNPNSKNYNGNGGTGTSGVFISKGLSGRKISKMPSFEDDFNENAKIAVDVRVDKAGSVIGASYQARGSTTSDASLREIALRKAKQIKFSSTADGAEEQVGTIIFNFRLKS
jgi:outer membrane biosynthesis protein TonB